MAAKRQRKEHASTRHFHSTGRAQLTLVEHSLCPLNPVPDLYFHEPEFTYTLDGKTQTAKARMSYPLGLFPGDEFYLWGLLALTFRQPEPSVNFYASARYCLTQLGGTIGGKQVALFRAAVERLSQAAYFNPAFYDPARHEHRRVAFGFLSYDSPMNDASLRAWHFGWDPIFFKFMQASGSYLAFDLDLYGSLSPASRRLFLFFKKFFYRKKETPWLDLANLSVNVAGYAAKLPAWEHKKRIQSCLAELAAAHAIVLPAGGPARSLQKRGKGKYQLRLQRGSHFDAKPHKAAALPLESLPLAEALSTLGFKTSEISGLLGRFPASLVRDWSEITLMRIERKLGFTKSPQAYLMHNLHEAAAGRRTAPDWYLEAKREEEQRQWRKLAEKRRRDADTRGSHDQAFLTYLKNDGRQYFESLMQDMFHQLTADGAPPEEAHQKATRLVHEHMRKRFESESDSPDFPLAG